MTAEREFVAGQDDTEEVGKESVSDERVDGEITLSFTFDASALEGKTVVAYEHVYRDGKEVATHADITGHLLEQLQPTLTAKVIR